MSRSNNEVKELKRESERCFGASLCSRLELELAPEGSKVAGQDTSGMCAMFYVCECICFKTLTMKASLHAFTKVNVSRIRS